MMEIFLGLYILIGFIVSCFTWKAYIEDKDEKKHVLPKWVWRVLIIFFSLFWFVFLIVYLIKRDTP